MFASALSSVAEAKEDFHSHSFLVAYRGIEPYLYTAYYQLFEEVLFEQV